MEPLELVVFDRWSAGEVVGAFGQLDGLLEPLLGSFSLGQDQQRFPDAAGDELPRLVQPLLELAAPALEEDTAQERPHLETARQLVVLERREEALSVALDGRPDPHAVPLNHSWRDPLESCQDGIQVPRRTVRARPEEFRQVPSLLGALEREIREQQQGFGPRKGGTLEHEVA